VLYGLRGGERTVHPWSRQRGSGDAVVEAVGPSSAHVAARDVRCSASEQQRETERETERDSRRRHGREGGRGRDKI